MTALLEIKGLSKTFSVKGKRFEALRDVNLSVGDKEFICLLGPSGSRHDDSSSDHGGA